MKDFTYSYPAHVYFGKGALANALKAELPAVAKKVLLAYGGGSIKKNGIYEEVTGLLQTLGKEVVDLRQSPGGRANRQGKGCGLHFGRGRRQRHRLLQNRGGPGPHRQQ